VGRRGKAWEGVGRRGKAWEGVGRTHGQSKLSPVLRVTVGG
jgi:hypothetical protein